MESMHKKNREDNLDLSNYRKYLSGSEFNSGLKIDFKNEKEYPVSRLEYLENLVQGKNIIHVGCADHKELIKDKIKKNHWLHKRLSDKAGRCLGVDIDKESIDYLINEFAVKDLLSCDLTRDVPDEIIVNKWDYMILGEILEHIDDPVSFLKAINSKYSKYVNVIIVTVPNAFRASNYKNAMHHAEYINSDHRYWFTGYTLMKVMTAGGFNVTEISFCENFGLSRRKFLHYYKMKNYPLLRESIVCHADWKK